MNITHVNLVDFVKRVYSLSKPQGMGFLQYVEGELSTEDANRYINPIGSAAVAMDYVHGRACKMFVERDRFNGNLIMHLPWFDHSKREQDELVAWCTPMPGTANETHTLEGIR